MKKTRGVFSICLHVISNPKGLRGFAGNVFLVGTANPSISSRRVVKSQYFSSNLLYAVAGGGIYLAQTMKGVELI